MTWQLKHLPTQLVLLESALLLEHDFRGPNLIERVVATTGCPERLAQKKVARMSNAHFLTGHFTQYAWPDIKGWRMLGEWLDCGWGEWLDCEWRHSDDLYNMMSKPEIALAFGTTRNLDAVRGDLQGIINHRYHLIRQAKQYRRERI